MAATPPTYQLTTIPTPVHAFLAELFNRAMREGLIHPDELPLAARLWDGIKNPQTISPAPPATELPPEDHEG